MGFHDTHLSRLFQYTVVLVLGFLVSFDFKFILSSQMSEKIVYKPVDLLDLFSLECLCQDHEHFLCC